MLAIFKDMVWKNLITYIDKINITSADGEEHVGRQKPVMECLLYPIYFFKQSNCQYFTNHCKVLYHIRTVEELAVNPLENKKSFDFRELKTKTLLNGFIRIVNYLSTFPPHLSGIAACLTDLQGINPICR